MSRTVVKRVEALLECGSWRVTLSMSVVRRHRCVSGLKNNERGGGVDERGHGPVVNVRLGAEVGALSGGLLTRNIHFHVFIIVVVVATRATRPSYW